MAWRNGVRLPTEVLVNEKVHSNRRYNTLRLQILDLFSLPLPTHMYVRTYIFAVFAARIASRKFLYLHVIFDVLALILCDYTMTNSAMLSADRGRQLKEREFS